MCCPHVFVCLYVFLGRRCIDCGRRPAPWRDAGRPAASRAPTPTPRIRLRVLSARPLSAGRPVTRSPVLAGPDGDPGPENPGTGHCCNPQCRLGGLAGSWVPGGHSQAAGPPWASLCGLVSSMSLAIAWGSHLPMSPREGPGKGMTWAGVEQRRRPLPSGLPGPTDRVKPVPTTKSRPEARAAPEGRGGREAGTLQGWWWSTLGPCDGPWPFCEVQGEGGEWRGAGLHLHWPVLQLESEARTAHPAIRGWPR